MPCLEEHAVGFHSPQLLRTAPCRRPRPGETCWAPHRPREACVLMPNPADRSQAQGEGTHARQRGCTQPSTYPGRWRGRRPAPHHWALWASLCGWTLGAILQQSLRGTAQHPSHWVPSSTRVQSAGWGSGVRAHHGGGRLAHHTDFSLPPPRHGSRLP